MVVSVADFNGDPNIGLYAKANNELAITGVEAPAKFVRKLEKTLNVDVVKTSIGGTSLVGVFTVFKGKQLIVSNIITSEEQDFLKSVGVRFKVLNLGLTAIGNNLVLSKKAVIANPEFSLSDVRLINKTLELPVRRYSIAGFKVPGSVVVVNNEKAGVTPLATSHDYKLLKSILGVNAEELTVNQGSGFVTSGLVFNEQGVLASNKCFGFELARIEQVLLNS